MLLNQSEHSDFSLKPISISCDDRRAAVRLPYRRRLHFRGVPRNRSRWLSPPEASICRATPGSLTCYRRGRRRIPPTQHSSGASGHNHAFDYRRVRQVNDRRNEKEIEEINASHILLKIEMGPNTNDALKRKSTLFSYDASDPKIGFYAALDSHQVSLKKVENIVNGATSLQSYGALREAVRFAYSSEVNDVSDPMQNDRYFIVAKLDSVLSEGTKSFEEVQNQIKSTMTQERGFTEAEQLAEKLRKELSKGSSFQQLKDNNENICLLYTSPSPRDATLSRMTSSA